MFVLFLILNVVLTMGSREVILSAGVGNYSRLSLQDQYRAYQTYTEIGLITGSSVLAYQLSTDGMLEEWPTYDPKISTEQFQYLIKTQFKLGAYPCIFCDATIGACSNLGPRINNMIANSNKFFQDSLSRAKKFGWDGYMVDFESDSAVNITELTKFMITWSDHLHQENLTLWLWMGGGTPYYMDMLSNNTNIKFVSMSTYVSTYIDFINVASGLQTYYGMEKMSYGLWTYPNNMPISENDMLLIVDWLNLTKSHSINLWAANIPPTWYKGLKRFLNTD